MDGPNDVVHGPREGGMPPRIGHQGNSGYMGNRQGRPPAQRRDRKDDRRRTNDDEETVLDSQDVSSIDRG